MAGQTNRIWDAMDDEALCARVRAGEQEALSVLFERYKPVIRLRSSTGSIAGIEPDDLMQEGLLGLFFAVLTYAPEGAASFKTYASVCISRRIASAKRSALGKKHLPLSGYLSLSTDGNSELLQSGLNEDPEQSTIDNERLSSIRAAIDERLSPLERQVLERRLEGVCYREIAQQCGVSVKAVDNAVQRIRKKLREFV